MKLLLSLTAAFGLAGMAHAHCGSCEKKDCDKAECSKSECSKSECVKSDCSKGDCDKSDCDKPACDKTKSKACPLAGMKTLSLKVSGLTDKPMVGKIDNVVTATKGAEICSVCTESGHIEMKYDPAQVKEADLMIKMKELGLGIKSQVVSYRVAGFKCEGCVSTFKEKLSAVDGVNKIEHVCHKSGRVAIDIDPAKTSSSKIKKAINATPFKVKDGKKKKQKKDAVAQHRSEA